ncbi:gamma-glutamylcyclotransferase family protein [Mangrovicella endophytica]|uniref:gamma-glutamylcyclotransferase family protein n=1 Tax=Mangrovicella endophytica TaxID=2066697 RepID=UPI000C9EB327|nr:gamma-glutamylcyclotransferase family protein [Mangrovicella endophytica]
MRIHDDHPDLMHLAAGGNVVAYFGYGSLVNRLTLRTKFLAIRRAEVSGWRRCWIPKAANPALALLSVRPEPDHVTQGVVVYDLADHLPSVDEREAGYARRIVDLGRIAIDGAPVHDVPLYIYEANRATQEAGGVGAAILQSYLDAVLQGFLALYGEAGVRRFVQETAGFETDVVRDRSAPRYPRSVSLQRGEAAFFDALLEARGVRYVEREAGVSANA